MKKLTLTTLALLLGGAASGMYSVGDVGSPLPAVSQAAKSSKSAKSSKASSSKKKQKKKASEEKKSTTKSDRAGAFEGMKLVTSSDWSDATAMRDALANDILKAMGGTSVKDAQLRRPSVLLTVRQISRSARLSLRASWLPFRRVLSLPNARLGILSS